MAADNLSKKKQKALSFRKGKDERAAEKAEKVKRKVEEAKKSEKKEKKEKEKSEKSEKSEKKETEKKETEKEGENKRKREEREAETNEGVKKRKTRRGKKGKGANNGAGPRYILFIGNLPYDTTQAEIEHHFQKCKADRIRLRREKGIAFLEFDSDNSHIKNKMDQALAMHHSIFRGRKINVELTAGGGGNSEGRVTKLKEKNDRLLEERRDRIKKSEAKKAEAKAEKNDSKSSTTGGMHPARAALLNQ